MASAQPDTQPTESSDLDWNGPDDPDCPYNWPLWKRIYMTSIPALLCVNVQVCPSPPGQEEAKKRKEK
jgi:hypothetical protein